MHQLKKVLSAQTMEDGVVCITSCSGDIGRVQDAASKFQSQRKSHRCLCSGRRRHVSD